MSNRTELSNLNDASKPQLTPKLRFPEFRDMGGWVICPLQGLYSFKSTNVFSRDQLNYHEGSVKNIHYGDIHTKFSTLFDINKERVPYINTASMPERFDPESFCLEGDIVLADASEDENDIGKSIEVINTNNEPILCGLHTILARQKKKDLITGFGGHLFKSKIVRSQIQRESQGTKVLGLSARRISNISVPYPADKDEQRKIADCLSSLDELITAQTQKLDALKTHKKGLMQQLFPAEGETVPTLRFPKFRDMGAWEVKKLAELSQIVRGGSPRPIENFITTADNGLSWLKIGDISQEAKYVTHTRDKVSVNALSKTREVNPGDLILSNSMSFGRPYILKIKTCIHDGWIAISKVDQSVIVDFLYYLISSQASQEYFLKNAAGSGVQNLNADIIKLLPVCISQAEEQQKIADCLSSLDELITAQTEKLDALKTHKKGLMQQLFPAMEEQKGA